MTLITPHRKSIQWPSLSLTRWMLIASLFLNVILLLGGRWKSIDTTITATTATLTQETLQWRGGHPLDDQTGFCFCNPAKYCLCSPNMAIDLLILSGDNHLWLVRRRDTNQLATMGGFVDVGESVEVTIRRELLEEMGVRLPDDVNPILFGIYSDPRRDNRRHTASAVFVVHLDKEIQPVAADDVKDVERISLDEIDDHSYFADHKTILTDFRSAWRGEPIHNNVGDFASDIARSLCIVKRDMFL